MDKLGYSVKEAAKALGASEDNVRKLIKAGHLNVIRFGNRVSISRASLEDLFTKNIKLSGNPMKPEAKARLQELSKKRGKSKRSSNTDQAA